MGGDGMSGRFGPSSNPVIRIARGPGTCGGGGGFRETGTRTNHGKDATGLLPNDGTRPFRCSKNGALAPERKVVPDSTHHHDTQCLQVLFVPRNRERKTRCNCIAIDMVNMANGDSGTRR